MGGGVARAACRVRSLLGFCAGLVMGLRGLTCAGLGGSKGGWRRRAPRHAPRRARRPAGSGAAAWVKPSIQLAVAAATAGAGRGGLGGPRRGPGAPLHATPPGPPPRGPRGPRRGSETAHQWFLMALSVRPGSSLAMAAHRFVKTSWAWGGVDGRRGCSVGLFARGGGQGVCPFGAAAAAARARGRGRAARGARGLRRALQGAAGARRGAPARRALTLMITACSHSVNGSFSTPGCSWLHHLRKPGARGGGGLGLCQACVTRVIILPR